MRTPLALLASLAVIGALASAGPVLAEQQNQKGRPGAAKSGLTQPGTKSVTNGGGAHHDNWRENTFKKGDAKGAVKK